MGHNRCGHSCMSEVIARVVIKLSDTNQDIKELKLAEDAKKHFVNLVDMHLLQRVATAPSKELGMATPSHSISPQDRYVIPVELGVSDIVTACSARKRGRDSPDEGELPPSKKSKSLCHLMLRYPMLRAVQAEGVAGCCNSITPPIVIRFRILTQYSLTTWNHVEAKKSRDVGRHGPGVVCFKMEFYEKAKELLSKNLLEEYHKTLNKLIDGRNSLSSNKLSSQVLADAYNTRGHIKYLWVDFDPAILDYSEAIQCDPSLAVAYYNRGQVHYRMGRYSLAEVDLLEALKLKPDFTDAALNLRQVQKDIASGHKFNV